MTRISLSFGNHRGFTLAELLVMTAVIGLVMAGIFAVQQGGQQAYLLGSNRVETQQNARMALDLMTRELRSAASITTLNGSTDITFRDQCGNSVRYSLSGARLNRTGSTYPDCSNGSSATALIGGVQSLAMTYYSVYDVSTGTYTTTTTAAAVRVIEIRLVTKTEESVAAGSPGDQRATMESTVKLRKDLS